MRLRYTPQALADLEEIQAYIAVELGNASAAKRIIASILRDAARLKSHPGLGVALARKTGLDIRGRALVSGQYMILYEEAERTVSVLRVLDTRVDYLRIVKTL